MKNKSLNKDFLLEFFKASLLNASILETGRAHLKFSYLPDQSYKKVWKIILDHYSVQGRPPSIGILGQIATDHPEVLSLVADVKAIGMPNRDDLLEQLELYIKNAKFQVAYDELYETFSKGDKEEAYKQLKDYADEIHEFSIKGQYFDKVFSGFDSRLTERRVIADNPTKIENNFKIPFGIPELDHITRGGISATDTACFLAQSGVGKSKVLKYLGVHAARLGYRIAHFQFEGSKKECLDLYDGTWSGVLMHNLEQGIVTEQQEKRIQKIVQDMKTGIGGEIYVEAFEQFGSASLVDVRNSIIELEKLYGKIHLVLIDYLEKVEPGDGKRYTVDQEKQRREAVAQKMKNLAVEFETRVITATQAHGIEKKLLDNPEFVMDRYNTSMGKNLLDPFSFFLTMNQTEDEKESKMMRIYCDKLRKYKSKQVVPIMQDYDKEKFCDIRETRKRFFKSE
jgi:hypothetical protein